MYKVIKYFEDLQDGRHAYKVGDEYPREGVEPTEERIAELSGEANKQGEPLIKEVKTKTRPKKDTKEVSKRTK